MEEHEGHHKRFLGLPPLVWLGIGLLVLLFVVSHRGSSGATVSGVAVPSTTATDLSNTQAQAAQLQLQQQQEALANKSAVDTFNLNAAEAQFGQAFQYQGALNALNLQSGAQQVNFAQQNQAVNTGRGLEQNALLQQQVNSQVIANSAAKAKNQQSSTSGWVNTLVGIGKTIAGFF